VQVTVQKEAGLKSPGVLILTMTLLLDSKKNKHTEEQAWLGNIEKGVEKSILKSNKENPFINNERISKIKEIHKVNSVKTGGEKLFDYCGICLL